MFKKVDVFQELQKVKENLKLDIIEEVHHILEDEIKIEGDIIDRMNSDAIISPINWSSLDESNIYSLESIRRICIKYRLRFLDSSKFKGELPYEAVMKVKQLEKKLGQPLSNFKIIAPKELFQLEDKDSDPLLFLELPNKKYYFIHKWGGELNPFRSALAFPLRSFMHMFWFLAAVAAIFSLLIPTSNVTVLAFLFVHSFIAICGIACMLVFSARENFSDVEWDSKYLS